MGMPTPTPSTDVARRSPLASHLFRPVDIASLVAIRLIFGGCMLWESSRYWMQGHLTEYLIYPEFHFKFYGFSWIDELPETMMLIVFSMLCISSFLVLIGAFYRIAATLLFLSFSYIFLLEASAYRNHWYLLALLALLMIFLPAHHAFSVDARRRPELRSLVTPSWTVWLLRFQLSLVYFFAGVAKIDPDWIAGRSLHAIFEDGNHSAEVLAFMKQGWVTTFFTWSGMLFDLSIAPALLWRKARLPAYLAAAGFHLTNALFLVDVGIFPWFMLLASTIYFEPNWLRQLIVRFDPSIRRILPDAALPPPKVLGHHHRLVVALLGLHIAIQLFLPLRQHLYPGSTAWTHEGHRWAWRMKLVSKDLVNFELFTVDPENGKRLPLTQNAEIALRPWQQERMSKQPDLLLQFVHDLHAQLLAKIGKDFPVYANIELSMSGRPPQPLVDPTVDLAKEKWTIAPAHWIIPLQKTSY